MAQQQEQIRTFVASLKEQASQIQQIKTQFFPTNVGLAFTHDD
jgi:hypothetical protein